MAPSSVLDLEDLDAAHGDFLVIRQGPVPDGLDGIVVVLRDDPRDLDSGLLDARLDSFGLLVAAEGRGLSGSWRVIGPERHESNVIVE